MAQHTPGPWAAWKSTASFWNVNKGNGEYRPTLATVHPNIPVGIDDAEAEANARLIAAAPDLLEALKAVWGHRPDHADTIWQQVEDAIAKATAAEAR